MQLIYKKLIKPKCSLIIYFTPLQTTVVHFYQCKSQKISCTHCLFSIITPITKPKNMKYYHRTETVSPDNTVKITWKGGMYIQLFSERELKFMFAICHRPSICRLSSVCLSVCLSSVTLVHPTQAIEIVRNISTPCGTLAIRGLCIKILRRSSEGNPAVGGVKHKSGSQI